LLIDAVASGKKAARSVYRYVTGHSLRPEAIEAHIPLDRYRREFNYEAIRRVELATRSAAQRLASPGTVVELSYTEEEACREASRCLDCGVTPVFDGTRCVLCGGCADVCPTACLKLVPLDDIEPSAALDAVVERTLGADGDRAANSAILKDEDRCIRCALCVMRCPVDAIAMERVQFTTTWSAA
jgi:ferredoxin